MIVISQIRMKPGYSMQDLHRAVLKKCRISSEELLSFEILKESLDARKHRGRGQTEGAVYLLRVAARLRDEDWFLKRCRDRDIGPYRPVIYEFPWHCQQPPEKRPVVVGSGPAGLFAGLMLARAGYRPILLERGGCVQERIRAVSEFWETGRLDPETNVQFGEGGAGTFSDGKLNTLVKDPQGLHRKVLEEFVHAGAPEQILYQNKPHLGTDALTGIVERIRSQIEEYQGTVRFHSRVTGLDLDEWGRLKGLWVNQEEYLSADAAILAVGHSARDTFSVLLEAGLDMEQKAFAIGVRAQHPQEMINRAQYGDIAFDRPADYKLSFRASDGRSVYTFCMCPGGYVVNASSEPGHLAVNGMSFQARDGINANSAVIVSIRPDDFESDHPLAGVAFQRRWEALAWQEGHGHIPAQLFGDFLDHRVSEKAGDIRHMGRGEICPADLNRCLPDYVCADLAEGIRAFGKKIPGFDRPDTILCGVETRTSSPVRILRDETMQSNVRGLFPCGEGAGYAGGITSAAMDGIRCAQALAAFLEEKRVQTGAAVE